MSLEPVRKFLRPIMNRIADIQLVSQPLWLLTHPTEYKMRAANQWIVLAKVLPGDMIFRRQDRALGTKFIPGEFSHVGLVVEDHHVVHAAGKGVERIDLLDFMRTDRLCVLRVADEALRSKAVVIATASIGLPYDYVFDSDDRRAMYCSELAMHCYPDLVPPRQQKRDAVAPDQLLTLPGTCIVYDSRKHADYV